MEKQAFSTIDCVIIEKGRVLLEKRRSGDWADYWCLPGGHVKAGEKVASAAVRETREETGFIVRTISLLGVYSGKRSRRCEDSSSVFLCKIIGGKRKLQPEEVTDLKFFPVGKLPKKIAFDHRKIIADAAAVLKGKKKAPIIS
jgi:8-oxo-dGTP diphosphatase